MKKRVIKVKLSEKGIDEAIKELENWYEWLIDKTKEFVKVLSDNGVEIARVNFGKAVYDGTNDVKVEVRENGEFKKAIVAIGSTVLFIEFGTGIKYPDDHPEKFADLAGRGEYGKKKGANPEGWSYVGNSGGTNGEYRATRHRRDGTATIWHTYGNPANMSMYLTREELKRKFEEVARRVFK